MIAATVAIVGLALIFAAILLTLMEGSGHSANAIEDWRRK